MDEARRFSGTVETVPGGMRLDRYASECLGLLSRSQLKSRMIDIRLNGRAARLSRPVKTGDFLELSWLPEAPQYLEPENIPLSVLYEDARCVVVNKPQGMVVHPGAGNHTGTLANALLWRKNERAPAGGQVSPRAGVVHRLDKDTSGVIIAAYDDEALAFLSAQFRARTVGKRYLALVRGTPKENEGTVHTGIIRNPKMRLSFTAVSPDKGKPALTRYRLIKSWGNCSLLLLKPRTGRTHQIRVHLKYLGCPILGDPVYGTKDGFPGTLMLHARSLSIVLPGQGGPSLFRAPLPERFTAFLKGAPR